MKNLNTYLREAKLRFSTLKRGTIVYHGTSDGDWDGESPNGPFWVTTSLKVAEYFKTWNQHDNDSPKVFLYKVSRPVKLVTIRSSKEMERLQDEYDLEKSSTIEFAESFCYRFTDGWIIPNNYQPGDDIMLCDPSSVLELIETIGINELPEDGSSEGMIKTKSGKFISRPEFTEQDKPLKQRLFDAIVAVSDSPRVDLWKTIEELPTDELMDFILQWERR